MKKSHVKLIGTVLMVSFVGSLLSACGGSKSTSSKKSVTDTSPITFTIFDNNHNGGAFDDPIAKEITKKTGVTLQYLPNAGVADEKLNLMLASNDMPDLVQISRGSDPMNKYINAKAVIPLNDLIDKYGPDIKSNYGDTLKKIKSDDGKNYYLADWFNSSVQKEPVFGFLMRKDYLKQVGVSQDKIDGTTPFTADEFEQLLKDFKAKIPAVNGQTSIPLTYWQENFSSGVLGSFQGMYGLTAYTVDSSNNLKLSYRDPKYLEMLKYMNKLQSEGLVDKEWPANKKALYLQKLTSGTVLGTPDAYWNPSDADSILKKQSVDSEFYPYKVVAPGIDPGKTTYGPTSLLGWDGCMITKNNKNPERAMKFLNFLASDEGQYLTQWGIKGVSWDIVDGKHKPLPNVLEDFAKDSSNYTKTTGIRKYALVFKGGAAPDGTPYDMAVRYQRDEIATHAIKALGDTSYDTSAFDNLGPDAGSPESLMATKINDISNVAITKIVLAKNESEVVSLYNNMISDMDRAGMSTVEKIRSANYKKRLVLWK
ncbi:MAG TPA: extracellular solute-binding protein [Ruminiclostridium sp.]